MNSQEPVSPSPSTPSSGSPPPDDIEPLPASLTPLSPAGSQKQSASQTKRRAPTSALAHRDLKARKRDDGASGSKRSFVQGVMGMSDAGGREGRDGRAKEELVDAELMERLKQEFGDPFDETTLRGLSQ